jgi:alpha-beta hydrolase superfamily lysophospholipase
VPGRIIDHPLLGARALFPRPARVERPFVVSTAGATLACWRAAPHPDAPTVLHFHGNGEVVADYVPEFAQAILALGVNIAFAEYRGYGGSTGRCSLGTILDDSEAVFQALALPPGDVIAFGRSLGSYAAIELASRHPLAGLVIESGIADPLERILMRVSPEELGVSAAALHGEVATLLGHERKLAAFHGPILVLHAIRDDLVDASHAVRIASWAAGEDRELVLFARGDHNSILAANRAEYFSALTGFIARVRMARALHCSD